MNATDTRDYIVQGFKDIIRDVEERLLQPDPRNIIRENSEARWAAQARVRAEYAAYGIESPCDLALSITARKEFGIGIVYVDEAAA
jgi:hypothetical protein